MSEYLKNHDGLVVVRQLTPSELKWFPRSPTRSENYLLTGKHFINGKYIANLEKFLKPGGDSEIGKRHFGMLWHLYASHAGFLGPNDSLRDTIQIDTDTVFGLGLTHADLGDFLSYFMSAQKFADEKLSQTPKGFEFNGRIFRYEVNKYFGSQLCPLDGEYTNEANTDHTLTDLETGGTLNYSGLMPHLIVGHGFYEGRGSPHRVAPEDIIRIGDLKPAQLSAK